MGRRPPVVVKTEDSAYVPGVYEHCLRQVCTEEACDPYFAISDEAEDPLRRWEFEADEAEKIDALIESHRGTVVYCQEFHLPEGCGELFKRFVCRCVKTFRVTSDDVVSYIPAAPLPEPDEPERLQHNGFE